jgi:hypothetical protein
MSRVEDLKEKYGHNHPILSKVTEDELRKSAELRAQVTVYTDMLFGSMKDKHEMKK